MSGRVPSPGLDVFAAPIPTGPFESPQETRTKEQD